LTVTVVVGGQYGDEGKGKIVSYLAHTDKPAIAVRGGVGPNAGHTVVKDGVSYKLRMLPSAVTTPGVRLMIGAGVVINPRILIDEIERFAVKDILVDRQCGIIEEDHLNRDRGGHLSEKIGTTGTGTGPANADRALRIARVAAQVPELEGYLGDVAAHVNEAAASGRLVLVEGTQGTFLSLYHGTYPYVTSKDITASGICADVGIGPKMVDEVCLVLKSYVTRVGGGPLKGEIPVEEAASRGWLEVATVTGRTRRSAPFDYDLARRAVMLNSATCIALTKLDVVFPAAKGMTSFDDLPQEAKNFIRNIEEKTKIPVSIIGTGPELREVIDRRKK